MGQGEFGGGGSVEWEVRNGNGHSGGGNKHVCKGKDNDPAPGSGGKFTVFVNGVQLAQVPVDGGKVVITWPGGLAARVAPPIRQGKRRKRRAKSGRR